MIIEEFDDEEENDTRISRSLHDPTLGKRQKTTNFKRIETVNIDSTENKESFNQGLRSSQLSSSKSIISIDPVDYYKQYNDSADEKLLM